MIFKKAARITVIIASFGVAGVRAQDAPRAIQLPSGIAARFADMVGHWTVSGTVTATGRTSSEKGVWDCSLVAAGTALMCIGKIKGPPGIKDIDHVYLFGYDPVHRKVWRGEVSNYSGAAVMTGPYSRDGFVLSRDFSTPNGDEEKQRQTFSGKIGSGELKETDRHTIDGKRLFSFKLTWVK